MAYMLLHPRSQQGRRVPALRWAGTGQLAGMGGMPNPMQVAKSMADSASRAVAKLFDQKAFDVFTQTVIAYVEKSNETVMPHVAAAMRFQANQVNEWIPGHQFGTIEVAANDTLFTLWKYKKANERIYELLKVRGALALGRPVQNWGPDEVLAGIALRKLRDQASRIEYGLTEGGFYLKDQRTWADVWDPLFKNERDWFAGQITDAVLVTLPAFNWFLGAVGQIKTIVDSTLDGAKKLANAGKNATALVDDGIAKLKALQEKLDALKGGALGLGVGALFLVGGAILLGVTVFSGVKGLK